MAPGPGSWTSTSARAAGAPERRADFPRGVRGLYEACALNAILFSQRFFPPDRGGFV